MPPTCTPINFGVYSPNDSSANWLPTKINSVTLTNSNGFVSIMKYKILGSDVKEEFSYRTENAPEPCEKTRECRDYYYLRYKGWNYKSLDLNLNFDVYRRSVMSINSTLYYKPDPKEVYSKGDVLIANIGNFTFTTNFNDAVFYTSIKLNNIVVDSVYEITSKRISSGIYPISAYFSKGLGLVGYTLSNNEIWTLEIK